VASDEPFDPRGVDLADADPGADPGPDAVDVAPEPAPEPAHEPAQEPLTSEADVVGTAPAASPRRTRTSPLRTALPWVLVVLAVAVAVVSTWRWQELAAVERAREDVAAATSQFVTTLTTWDASAGMVETREALRSGGTELFGSDVDELFGSTEDLRGLAELGARSEGEVRQVYVQSLQDDRAETLAVVLQQVTTAEVQDPEFHLRYAAVELQLVEGRWLVDQLELLVDTSPSSDGTGEGAAPTTEGTDAEEGQG
jgi:hypothetical protein